MSDVNKSDVAITVPQTVKASWLDPSGRGQQDQRSQAAHPGRHAGSGVERDGSSRPMFRIVRGPKGPLSVDSANNGWAGIADLAPVDSIGRGGGLRASSRNYQ